MDRANQVYQEPSGVNQKENPMKLIAASPAGPAHVSYHDMSGYEATHKGALNILEKGRPTATWARVSPAVLGEIDRYVHALVAR